VLNISGDQGLGAHLSAGLMHNSILEIGKAGMTGPPVLFEVAWTLKSAYEQTLTILPGQE